LITDCHIHIQPMEMFNPGALAAMKRKRPNFEQICEFCRSPRAFLKYLDSSGIDRAVLINYVAPEVIGFTAEVNAFIAGYVKEDPRRLISCGSLHPRHSTNFMADMDHLLRLGIRMIKVHPPHQLLYPNDYLHGVKELEILYRAAEANGVPVMVHTGTSIFPGARNKFGDPIHVDDVAVDFPRLKILLAHGGRPLWMKTAFFLVRRHSTNFMADMDHLLRLGIRMIKVHPPHQLLYPNDYLHGVKELEILYRAAEANGVPVMVHTGTSIFPGARNKFGDPIYVDDVAVDFPRLKILLAHGGRPLWMNTAFFLVRRHSNVYLDISGIPPKTLLKYFPRLEEIAARTVFGTDWPGPGVPDIKQNLDDFRALPLSESAREQILVKTALSIWPA